MKRFYAIILLLIIILITGCTTGNKITTQSESTTSINEETTTTTEGEVIENITVTNPEDLVINYNQLVITKGVLYQLMKTSIGLSTLINQMDRDLLLEDYGDKVNTVALEEKIAADKKSQGEDSFYQNLIIQGVISSIDDPQLDEKIKDYYLTSFLQTAYAKDNAINEIIENDPLSITNAKEGYHEDICAIILKYDSTNKADQFYDDLALADDKFNFFAAEYNLQHSDGDLEIVEVPGFISEFNCQYDRVSYEDTTYSASFRDFIFDDEFNNEPFEFGNYNKIKKFIQSDLAYYFVYKVSKPQYIADYRNSEVFTQYIIDNLVKNKLTYTYINTQMKELYQSIDLKIYDNEIGNQYKTNLNKDFEPETELSNINKNIVASYEVLGKIQYVYADNLYASMKIRFAVPILLEKINIEALKTIPEIQLSETEKNSIITQILNYKTQYLQQTQPYTWSEHIALNFGVFSEAELLDFIAAPTLIERYVNGYEEYAGADPVTDEDIDEAYNEWFSIKASHILFTFELDDAESKELARKKGEQVINGCTDLDDLGAPQYREGIDAQSCEIFYDLDNPTDTDTDVPFAGLDDTNVSQYITTIQALAFKYSDDPSAPQNKGDLGYFGPGVMVPEFENAVKEIASRVKEGGAPFSFEPVESTLEREDGDIHSFHVIYVTSIYPPKVEQPDLVLYEQYLEDLEDDNKVVNDIYTPNQINQFNRYRTFLDTLKVKLEESRKTAANQNKHLTLLRETLGIAFIDAEIQAIYENTNLTYQILN